MCKESESRKRFSILFLCKKVNNFIGCLYHDKFVFVSLHHRPKNHQLQAHSTLDRKMPSATVHPERDGQKDTVRTYGGFSLLGIIAIISATLLVVLTIIIIPVVLNSKQNESSSAETMRTEITMRSNLFSNS